jgi:hypothetical protein
LAGHARAASGSAGSRSSSPRMSPRSLRFPRRGRSLPICAWADRSPIVTCPNWSAAAGRPGIRARRRSSRAR